MMGVERKVRWVNYNLIIEFVAFEQPFAGTVFANPPLRCFSLSLSLSHSVNLSRYILSTVAQEAKEDSGYE